ncbi:MAG: response regulator [Candidatus Marinimicrobia bacterium]|nr:response regulator [Candidatus Neomarinimicrobiota bacterium]
MKRFFALIVCVIILSVALFTQTPVADFSPGKPQVGTVLSVVKFTGNSAVPPFGCGILAMEPPTPTNFSICSATVPPDIVIMDVSMPGMDGFETTERLLAEHPLVKVIILTIL